MVNTEGGIFNPSRGTWQYSVASPYLAGTNLVEVLLPESFDASRRYRVLYVLPVEAALGGAFGDGMMEARKIDAHNKHDLICVYPTFDTPPWYGRHATDPHIRHEAHFCKVVLPLIESRYPAMASPRGRLLLGYSKSGWGAFSLILRNPDLFGCAASWDAPLMLTEAEFGAFGTDRHFGTVACFKEYMPRNLLASARAVFGGRPRLVVAGSATPAPPTAVFANHNRHTGEAHAKMQELGISHLYTDQLPNEHHWNTGWVAPVLDMLMSIMDS